MSTHDEDERLRALHRLAVLDTPREERFDRMVLLAQRLFDVPMVAVNLIDRDRQWTKASVGLEDETIPRRHAFCSQTIENSGPMVVEDAREDPRFQANPYVTGNPKIRFYAGQPLRAPGGQQVGALCIIDDKPRSLSAADAQLLAELAAWVEHELAHAESLSQAEEVQRRLLPRRAPHIEGYAVAGRCIMADQVGGDFFDWDLIGEGLQITVADVMGKGLAAAIVAAGVRATLRGAFRYNGVAEAVTRSAHSLEADLAETARFVTLFSARLNPRSHRMEWVDAGHGLAAILPADGSPYRQLVSHGLPMGVLADDRWISHRARLAAGDTLVVVSDGLLDLFGSPEATLAAVQRANHESRSVADLIERVSSVSRAGRIKDDVTIVAVRREAG